MLGGGVGASELQSGEAATGSERSFDDRSSSEAARKLTVAQWWRQERDAERAAAATKRRRKRQRRKRSREKAAKDHDIAVLAEHGDVDDEDACGELFEENFVGPLDARSATASDSESQMAAADKAGLDAVANAARRAWYVQPAEVTKLMAEHEFVYFYTAASEGLLDLTHKFVPELTAKIDAFRRAMPAVT